MSFIKHSIFLHELAHYLIAKTIPSIKVTSVNFNSHVKYESKNLTATRTFLIGYAPFYILISISYIALYIMQYYVSPNLHSDLMVLVYIGLSYISIISILGIIPSIQDAKQPYILLKKQLFMFRRIPFVLLFGPIIIILGLPGLLLSHIYSKLGKYQILLNLLIYFILIQIMLNYHQIINMVVS